MTALAEKPDVSFTVDHSVPRQSREAFLACADSLDRAVRAWPGCASVEMTEVASEEADVLHFRTTTSFDSKDALIAWIDSDVRRQLLDRTQSNFTYDYKLTAYDGWFPAADGTPPPLSAWKANMIVLLVLYPTVLALGLVLGRITRLMSFPAAMLLSNFCSVAITGFWLIPYASRVYGGWLRGPVTPRMQLLAPLSVVALLLGFMGLGILLLP